MRKPEDITRAEVRELLDYSPETGEFRWRKSWVSRGHTAKQVGAIATYGTDRLSVHLPGGPTCKAHRLAWFYVHGEWPPEQLDHIDGNPLNNALTNLRPVTNAQNNQNKVAYCTNKTGVLGVRYIHNRAKHWAAYLMINGKGFAKGFFTFDEAVAYRKELEQKHHPYQARSTL